MSFPSWQEFYASDLQSVYALIPIPTLFLLYLRFAPKGDDTTARFMRGYAVAFGLETILDPIVTGPVVRVLGLAGSRAADLILLLFVLLGDFRVFLLLFFLAGEGRAFRRVVGESAAWSLIVPVLARLVDSLLRAAIDGLPSQSIWFVYELAFTAMATLLGRFVLPARARAGAPERVAYLRTITRFVGSYYALWATSDILVLTGHDAGWALRIVPNQMYYAFFLPFAYALFFSRRYASTSTATQASR